MRYLFLLVLVACNRTTFDPGPEIADASGGDDARSEGACGTASVVVTPGLDSLEGDAEIAGVVQFPAATPGAVRGALIVSHFSPEPGVGNIIETFQLAAGKSSLAYAIRDLKPDGYFVQVLVDLNDDLEFGDPDWAGFFGGTTSAPALYTNIAEIDATGGLACDGDFGIGDVVCKKSYGQACSSDDDCRGTITECDGGVKSFRDTGACQGTCTELPAESCGNTAALGTTEGSCFGGF